MTVNNAAVEDTNDKIRFGGCWTLLESEGMSFWTFNARVMQAPGLDDVDLQEPVFDLLIKVQKTCEQKLVHGRYLDPVL